MFILARSKHGEVLARQVSVYLKENTFDCKFTQDNRILVTEMNTVLHIFKDFHN